MDFQFWNLTTSTNMFNSTQKSSIASNVSSYFRRPSKVVKTSSKNNSPRTPSRRRMTTTGHIPPSRTRSVVDHQRSSMPQLSNPRSGASRPLSWHPNMLQELSQYQMPVQYYGENFSMAPYTTAEVNGLATPVSFPVMDEPQISELITPLEGLSATEAGSEYDYRQDFDMTQYWISQQAKDSMINLEPSPYPMMNYQPWFPTAMTDAYMMPNVPTAPTSPSFMPLPEFDVPLNVLLPEPEDDSEELVGMGLYDSPTDLRSSSMLFSGLDGATGRKSLKLEDSFEPSPEDEDGNDDDDDDTEEDEDEDAAVAPEEDDLCSQSNISPPLEDTYSATIYHQPIDNSYIRTHYQASRQDGYNWI